MIKLVNRKKRLVLTVFFITIMLSLTLFSIYLGRSTSDGSEVSASDDLYDELERLEEELAEIGRQKRDLEQQIENEEDYQNELSAQIYNLSNSISQLELDIKEIELDVEHKETEIKILEEEITEAELQIAGIEKDVNVLEETAEDIVRNIYVESRTNSMIDLFLASKDSKSFMSQLQYHTSIGEHDQNTLQKLQKDKQIIQEQRDKMAENKVEVEKLAEQIRIQKEQLEKDQEQLAAQKSQKNRLLQDSEIAEAYYDDQYNRLSDEEKKTLAELDYVLQQLVNTPTKPKGYVVKGQVIATEASNGCSTGAHTHYALLYNGVWSDPCRYLPYKSGLCGSGNMLGWPYNGPFWMSRGFTKGGHEALDLYKGWGSQVVASHNGYFFEETSSCSNSWCTYGCSTPYNTCAKVCENANCQGGKVTLYCHVNFLPE